MQAKTTFTREADFRRERDFGTKVGATFDFVTAQFRPLFKCLAYFVLPAALLAGIGMGLVAGPLMEVMAKAGARPGEGAGYSGGNPFTDLSLAGVGLGAAGLLAAFLLLSSTVYGFVRVRMSTPPAEAVTPAWKLRSTFSSGAPRSMNGARPPMFCGTVR